MTHKKIKQTTTTYCLLVLLLILGACSGTNDKTQITGLRCEYMDEALGIDNSAPRFSWRFTGNEQGFKQKQFRIQVASSPELLEQGKADIWTSKKIKSGQALTAYEGTPLASHTRYYWNVQVWDNHNNRLADSPVAWFETAKMNKSDWKAKWITDDKDKDFRAAPIFRKTFTADKDIQSARAYVTGAGYYELYLNGDKVGNNLLDPGYTAFDKRVLYSTYDVTSQLQKGENTVAAMLGNGWYNVQSVAVWDFEKARWRNRPRMICELRIQYTDGSESVIVSDETWKTSLGAVTFNNIYSGDIYDATAEQPGWNKNGFDDSGWGFAQITECPAPVMQAQTMPAIRVEREVKPKSIKAFSDKLYVFDLGENIAGGSRLKVKGQAGTRITLKHGELLKADGRLEQGNINIYFHPVDKSEVFQMDEFILKGTGEEEIFEPRFNYHGFQYVEVESSKPITLTQESLTGLFFHTDVKPVGTFSCSNDLLNKIWEATNRSYVGNLHSIPTDCPQREKNGWTADAHISVDLGLLNYDGIKVYEKWMTDFIDNQREEGDISGIIPTASWGYGPWIGPVWDAALFIIPRAIYSYYGDSRIIETLYPTFEKYLSYLKKKEVDGLLNYGLGDWLPDEAQTPNDYTSSCYYYVDYVNMAEFAKILGKDPKPYLLKADTIKNLINNKYLNPETGVYANGTQTAQGLALYLGIVPLEAEQKVVDKLVEVVNATDCSLNFGVIGSKTVPIALTKYGQVEMAYKMVAKDTAPSWGYWVTKMGGTTLFETWLLSPRFNDASLNHVFMGNVSAWMYNSLAGIDFDSENPGFKNVIMHPHFVKDLDWVKGEYNAVSGKIVSEWKRSGDAVEYSVQIPANVTATVYLPEGAIEAPVKGKREKSGNVYSLSSGEYKFVIR